MKLSAQLLVLSLTVFSPLSQALDSGDINLDDGSSTPLDPRCGPAGDAFTKANGEYLRLEHEVLEKCSDLNDPHKKWPKKGSPENLQCVALSKAKNAAYRKCSGLRCAFWDYCGIAPGAIQAGHCAECM
jgi:hypothetical protein